MPPPTPVQFPNYNPRVSDSVAEPHASLVQLLQSLHRPASLGDAYFDALGVHVHPDAPAEDILPDRSYLPSNSEEWEGLTLDQASAKDPSFQIPLSNGSTSPAARSYLERLTELSIDNEAAYRTVRRIRPEPGTRAVRLGNSYEFFRQLEQMAGYWDDTSMPPVTYADAAGEHGAEQAPCTPAHDSAPTSGSADPVAAEQPDALATGAPDGVESSSATSEPEDKSQWRVTYRSASGSSMPTEIRHNLISAFIKLVSYDFGCNITAPRVEPRVHLLAPPRATSSRGPPREPTASYFVSGCVVLTRTPTTREAARSGVVEGPLAAISARNTTSFTKPTERYVDFGRELVAALVTAQLRAREGHEEKRFGEGKWWATAKRWGGGEGGPIGREADGASGVVGDKDKIPDPSCSSGPSAGGAEKKGTGSSMSGREAAEVVPAVMSRAPVSPSSGLPMHRAPLPKRVRKGHMSIYDNYRQVRLPQSNWDKKARYSAIGKVPGTDYDDVFVISSLFHHVSILRVRVPRRLLDVLAGAADGGERSWGSLEVWRSKWFDLFQKQERLEALRLLWGANTWMMRKVEGGGEGSAAS